MGRRRKTELANPIRIKEICLKHGIDPFEEMVKIALETIKVPKDTDPELLKALIRQYKERYELVSEDGDHLYFRTKQEFRLRVWEGASKFVYPQLKASDNRTETDYQIHVTVKQFEVKQPTVVIEDARPAIPEVVEVEEVETDA